MLQSVDRAKAESSIPVEFSEASEDVRRSRTLWLVLKAVLQAILALAVLYAAVAGMNRLVATKPEVPKRAALEKSYTVVTATAVQADHTPTISVYGEVTAGRTVDLRALVGGEIVEVHPGLKAGGLVSSGDTLVAIDRFDYEGAMTEAKANLAEAAAVQVEYKGRVALEVANIARAQEQLGIARRDLERAEALIARGSVTEQALDERRLLVSQRQQTLEQRQNALAQEQARVDQQEAAIGRLRWRLENAERQLANTVLKAPFDAIVRTEAAQPGRLVSVNDVVASIFARDDLEVRFTLSDNQYGRIVADAGTVVGRVVEVVWYLGTEPLVYTATVARIGADVATTRGGVDVYAVIDYDPAQTPLRPGAFVEVKVPDRTYFDTFRIPETALYGDGLVYLVEDSRLVPRVTTPLAFDGGAIIVRDGLRDGETLLTTRVPEAGEGLLVKPTGVDSSPQSDPSEAGRRTSAAVVKPAE